MEARLTLFVHGWGVHHTETYGDFPERLQREAERDAGLALDVRHIWLGKYVSFKDEVRLDDLAVGFDAALGQEVGSELRKGRRFICITHSTGGPVVRLWWDRYYLNGRRRRCPMSHLVMLAPPNFGSALAQLGKSRVSRLKCWFEGVDPGQGVLDWLELGSRESWRLNSRWIDTDDVTAGDDPVFPFVLSGQTIDRKLYDHVNSYTGEIGSDGVVRLASAQLNACYADVVQEPLATTRSKGRKLALLKLGRPVNSRFTAFAVLAGRSHTGDDKGILRSVGTTGSHVTVKTVLECLRVRSRRDYRRLAGEFVDRNARVFERERVEVVRRRLLPDWVFIHDRCSQIIFRLRDDEGNELEDFDLVLTGDQNDPDGLPAGFFVDRQGNRRNRNTVTYYINYDLLRGSDEPIPDPRDRRRRLRPALSGLERFGIRISPRPLEGFVHFLPCQLNATIRHLQGLVEPNQTTLVDITLRRVVHEGVFRLTRDRAKLEFKDVEPGEPL